MADPLPMTCKRCGSMSEHPLCPACIMPTLVRIKDAPKKWAEDQEVPRDVAKQILQQRGSRR